MHQDPYRPRELTPLQHLRRRRPRQPHLPLLSPSLSSPSPSNPSPSSSPDPAQTNRPSSSPRLSTIPTHRLYGIVSALCDVKSSARSCFAMSMVPQSLLMGMWSCRSKCRGASCLSVEYSLSNVVTVRGSTSRCSIGTSGMWGSMGMNSVQLCSKS